MNRGRVRVGDTRGGVGEGSVDPQTGTSGVRPSVRELVRSGRGCEGSACV